MRFKKVLLVNPFYSSKFYPIPVLPAGLGYLAECLKSAFIDYDIIDMALGYDLADLKRKIKSYSPDLIGFSIMTYRYMNTYEVIAEVKKEFPQIKIVCGGPHISNLKNKIFEECPDIDYGVTFEGEETLIELASGNQLESIKGLIYKKGDKVVYNGDRDFIVDLDRIPFPRYEKFEIDKYKYGISMVTSRGCPFSCIYCSCHLLGKKIRFRSPGNVAEEFEYWYGRGFREFGLQEDNPTFNKERMYRLCDEIEKKGLKGIMIMCGNGVRADRIDKELLIRMKQAGFKRLAFGVEAGNNAILKNIKKNLKIETIENAISTACDLGFYVSLFFLVGSPGERVKDVRDSIALALKYPVSDVKFNNLVPIPGTELYRWVKENNYLLMEEDEYLNMDPPAQLSNRVVFQTPEFTASERLKMLKETKNVERRVKRRVIERKLPFCLGLNKAIARLYTTDFIRGLESVLFSSQGARESIGKIRMRVRKYIYERS
ncbi:MAG: hypothetical protein DRP74_01920 [Candidatus Omnitrophota bacterium]|nr:MAG: hypothetical protein DRP74_01920 [Candidatus Omnitrophota bacterium]